MQEPRPSGYWQSRPATAAEKRQRKALEGRLRNEHYRAITPINRRIEEIEQEVASTTERINEIEAMMTDPSHYDDSEKVVAFNREHTALKERLARLTAEWDELTAEAERIKTEYRRAQEIGE
jgi:ATP-binding cassette, subfamily F, member 3